MAGPWNPGPLPTRPSTVPASWAEEIAAMTDRHGHAGPDPAWQQDDESDRGEPPEGSDLDAIYDDLGHVMDLVVFAENDRALLLLSSVINRLARAIP